MDQHTPTAALLHPPEDRPLDAAITDMTALLERHGYVVAVYPATVPLAHERRLHTVRSVLESNRIALLKVDLPPLGTAVLVRQLRQLSVCDFGPGVIASAARLLSHYVHAGAQLSSVTRLDRVPVGMKSHAKSWVPGSQFAVVAHPAPELVRIGGDTVPAGPAFPTRMAVARGQLHSEWTERELAPAWRAQGVEEVPLPAESPAWWGTGKLVEFAAFLPEISVLYQLVSSVRREPCTWCGIELIGDRCGFCSAPLAGGDPQQGRESGVLRHGTPAYHGP
ncbi:hypothetical protein I3J09_09285 [Streptomyces clavuligerus]|uniref:Uncharacterized protein n=3 Tax=Streptomyces clavuligerus TaxID=1901 RepID=E2Q446_STRCL|nr:hypothetical protein [Streptomyces clavuligerus]ANW18390.1 hypothetical protein BB341_09180 [Streptomyces clavuligerus]AXU12945.1 hypothetical protein D1794_09510 [Streptomyces clavuligerus]EFG08984.1 Hypothetical protein SCLAV_3910 [Streptomyces clavuligerus]MBY6302873.1 hypothetical protein [Streptomyces clavuligerus]QCS05729.1 hypothetical protein CRV15_08940 [Streptomyces clavuligerus]